MRNLKILEIGGKKNTWQREPEFVIHMNYNEKTISI